MSARGPTAHRAYAAIAYALGGVLLLGGILDAISNARAIPREWSYALLIGVTAVWALLEIGVSRFGLSWRARSGQPFTVRRLGVAPRMFLGGTLLLVSVSVISNVKRELPNTKDEQASRDDPWDRSSTAVPVDAKDDDKALAEANDADDLSDPDTISDPEKRYSHIKSIAWDRLAGMACSDLFSGASYRLQVPGGHANHCTPSEVYLHSDYLGVIGGTFHKVYRVNEDNISLISFPDRPRLGIIGHFVRQDFLFSAGAAVFRARCKMATDRIARVEVADVSHRVRCDRASVVRLDEVAMCEPFDECHEAAMNAFDRDAAPSPDVPWTEVWHDEYVHVAVSADGGNHAKGINVRLDDQRLMIYEVDDYGGTCNDFPATLVVSPALDIFDENPVQRVYRLDVRRFGWQHSGDLYVSRCRVVP